MSSVDLNTAGSRSQLTSQDSRLSLNWTGSDSNINENTSTVDEAMGFDRDDFNFLRVGDSTFLTTSYYNVLPHRPTAEVIGFMHGANIYEEHCKVKLSENATAASFRHYESLFVVENCVASRSRGVQSFKTMKSRQNVVVYGNIVQFRHFYSGKILHCAKGDSAGALTNARQLDNQYYVGLFPDGRADDDSDETWFRILPNSKQRLEGEKVKLGDEILLVSITSERFVEAWADPGKGLDQEVMVKASFRKCTWKLNPFNSYKKDSGMYLKGGDVIFFSRKLENQNLVVINKPKGSRSAKDAPLTIAFLKNAPLVQMNSFWVIELLDMKWGGSYIGWGQQIRLRHLLTGLYLCYKTHPEPIFTLTEELMNSSIFLLRPIQDEMTGIGDGSSIVFNRQEGLMGTPSIRFGDTLLFLQHNMGVWIHAHVDSVSGDSKEGQDNNSGSILKATKSVDVSISNNYVTSTDNDCVTIVPQRECSIDDAIVVYKISPDVLRDGLMTLFGTSLLSNIRNFLFSGAKITVTKDVEEDAKAKQAKEIKASLQGYFASFDKIAAYFKKREREYEVSVKSNDELMFARVLLASEFKVINLVGMSIRIPFDRPISSIRIEEIDDPMNADAADLLRRFYGLLKVHLSLRSENKVIFMKEHSIDLIMSHLGHGLEVIEIIIMLFEDNPECTHHVTTDHIDTLIDFMEKNGRDGKVVKALANLCTVGDKAIRKFQNYISDAILDRGRNLLLDSRLTLVVESLYANLYIPSRNVKENLRTWYYEVEVTEIPNERHIMRLGWATKGFQPQAMDGRSVGDDCFSYGYDLKSIWHGCESEGYGGFSEEDYKPGKCCIRVGVFIDFEDGTISYTVNGKYMGVAFRNINLVFQFVPVVSISHGVELRVILGNKDSSPLALEDKMYIPVGHVARNSDEEVLLSYCHTSGVLGLERGLTTLTGCGMFQDETPPPTQLNEIHLPIEISGYGELLAESMHTSHCLDLLKDGYDYSDVDDRANKKLTYLKPFNDLESSVRAKFSDQALQAIKNLISLGYLVTYDPNATVSVKRKKKTEPLCFSNGFCPIPLSSEGLELPNDMEEMVDKLAENSHNTELEAKKRDGWCFSFKDDDQRKYMTALVPYHELDEGRKDIYRGPLRETIQVIISVGFKIRRFDVIDGGLKYSTIFRNIRTFHLYKSFQFTSGKWYYEAEILSEGYVRVGFAHRHFNPDPRNGIGAGDDNCSWAFDSHLARKWHSYSSSYGERALPGDIIGCCLDCDKGEIRFMLNGKTMIDHTDQQDIAFNDLLPIIESGLALCPVFSVGSHQSIRVNLGSVPFSFYTGFACQEGYKPVKTFLSGSQDNFRYMFASEYLKFSNVEYVHSRSRGLHIEKTYSLDGTTTLSVLKEETSIKTSDSLKDYETLRLNMALGTCKKGLFYYEVIIPTSQDETKIYMGWASNSFIGNPVLMDLQSKEFTFLVGGKDFPPREDPSTTWRIGCYADLDNKELWFSVNGAVLEDEKFKFKITRCEYLYPMICVSAGNKHVADVVFCECKGINGALPLTRALLTNPASYKLLRMVHPRRLSLQLLHSGTWEPVFSPSLIYMDKLDDRGSVWNVRGDFREEQSGFNYKSQGHYVAVVSVFNQYESMVSIFRRIPLFLRYEINCLLLFCQMAYAGNDYAIEKLRQHICPYQMLYVIRHGSMPQKLRTAFCKLLISVHLYPRLRTNILKSKYVYSVKSLRDNAPSPFVFLKEEGQQSFPWEDLKDYCIHFLKEKVYSVFNSVEANLELTGSDIVASILTIVLKLLVLEKLDEDDIADLLSCLDENTFGSSESENRIGLIYLRMSDEVKMRVCYILGVLCNIILKGRVRFITKAADEYLLDYSGKQSAEITALKRGDSSIMTVVNENHCLRKSPVDQVKQFFKDNNPFLKSLNEFIVGLCGRAESKTSSSKDPKSLATLLERLRNGVKEDRMRHLSESSGETGSKRGSYRRDSTQSTSSRRSSFSVFSGGDSYDNLFAELRKSGYSYLELHAAKLNKFCIDTMLEWTEKRIRSDSLKNKAFELLYRQYRESEDLCEALGSVEVICELPSLPGLCMLLGSLVKFSDVVLDEKELMNLKVLLQNLIDVEYGSLKQKQDMLRVLGGHKILIDIIKEVYQQKMSSDRITSDVNVIALDVFDFFENVDLSSKYGKKKLPEMSVRIEKTASGRRSRVFDNDEVLDVGNEHEDEVEQEKVLEIYLDQWSYAVSYASKAIEDYRNKNSSNEEQSFDRTDSLDDEDLFDIPLVDDDLLFKEHKLREVQAFSNEIKNSVINDLHEKNKLVTSAQKLIFLESSLKAAIHLKLPSAKYQQAFELLLKVSKLQETIKVEDMNSLCNDLMGLFYKFFVQFCEGNSANQVLVFVYYKSLVTRLYTSDDSLELLSALVKGNSTLCILLGRRRIDMYLDLLSHHVKRYMSGEDTSRNIDTYLDFLKCIVKVNGESIVTNCMSVVTSIVSRPELLVLFNGVKGYEERRKHVLMCMKGERNIGSFKLSGLIGYHVNLISLFADCANICSSESQEAKLSKEKVQNMLASLMSQDSLLSFLTDDLMPLEAKAHYHKLFLNIYGVSSAALFKQLVQKCYLHDMNARVRSMDAVSQSTNTYIFKEITSVIKTNAHFLLSIENFSYIVDGLIHVLYNMSRLKCCWHYEMHSKLMLECFLNIAKSCHPSTFLRVMRRFSKDLNDYKRCKDGAQFALRVLNGFYEAHCKYFGISGDKEIGFASLEEKQITAILGRDVIMILKDIAVSESSQMVQEAVACYTKIVCALAPDFHVDLDWAKVWKITQGNSGCASKYEPSPVDVSFIRLTENQKKLAVLLAEQTHNSWALRRKACGWKYGPERNDEKKKNPKLMPFGSLSEQCKDFSVKTAEYNLKLIQALGYSIAPVGDTWAKACESIRKKEEEYGSDPGSYCPVFEVIDLEGLVLAPHIASLADRVAENIHDQFVMTKKQEGYRFGYVRSLTERTHPNLVPYDMQTKEAKDLDHEISVNCIKLIKYFGFDIKSKFLEDGYKGSVKKMSLLVLEKCIEAFDLTVQESKSASARKVYTHEHFCMTVLIPIMSEYFDKHGLYFGGKSVYSNASHEERKLVIMMFQCVMERIRLTLYPLSGVDKDLERRRRRSIPSNTISEEMPQSPSFGIVGQFVEAVAVKPFIMTEALIKQCRKCLSKLIPVLPANYHSNFCLDNMKYLEDALTDSAAADFSFEIVLPTITLIFDRAFCHLCFEVEHIDDESNKLSQTVATTYSDFLGKADEEKMEEQKMTMKLFNIIDKLVSAEAGTRPKSRMVMGEALATITVLCPETCSEVNVEGQTRPEQMISDLITASEACCCSKKGKPSKGKGIIVPFVCDVTIPILCSYARSFWVKNPLLDVGEYMERSEEEIRALIEDIVRNIIRLASSKLEYERKAKMVNRAKGIVRRLSMDFVVNEVFVHVCEKVTMLYHLLEKLKSSLNDHEKYRKYMSLKRDMYKELDLYFTLLASYFEYNSEVWAEKFQAYNFSTFEKGPVYFCVLFENLIALFNLRFEKKDFGFGPNYLRDLLKFMHPIYMQVFGEHERVVRLGSQIWAKKGLSDTELEIEISGLIEKLYLESQKELFEEDGEENGKELPDIFVSVASRSNIFDSPEAQKPSKSSATKSLYRLKSRNLLRGFSTSSSKLEFCRRKKLDASVLDDKKEVDLQVKQMGLSQAFAFMVFKAKELYLNLTDRKKRCLASMMVKRMTYLAISLSRLQEETLTSKWANLNKRWHQFESLKRLLSSGIKLRRLDYFGNRNINLLSVLLKENAAYHEKFSSEYENDLTRLHIDLKKKRKNSNQENEIRVKQLIGLMTQKNTSESVHLKFADALCKSCVTEETFLEYEGHLRVSKKIEWMRELGMQQLHLAKRGAGEMVIDVISGMNGLVCARSHSTLKLGIAMLSGGNTTVQNIMFSYLNRKKDFRFTQSLYDMIEKCRSFDLELLSRAANLNEMNLIALEDLEKKEESAVSSLSEFGSDLFRFLQLLCEGHNEKFQNYLRDQPQNSKSFNLVVASVDFLMFLQEGLSNLHWTFVSSGMRTEHYDRASVKIIAVANQVFRSLTEYIQGPCVNNQKALSKSRLWDCVNAFLSLLDDHINCMLRQVPTFNESIRQFLTLYNAMLDLLLAMLEGGMQSKRTAELMLETFTDSYRHIMSTLTFCAICIRSASVSCLRLFQRADPKLDGFISVSAFKRILTDDDVLSVKHIGKENIDLIVMSTNPTSDGRIDYVNFASAFHKQADDIAFSYAVLMKSLNDRLNTIGIYSSSSMLKGIFKYFENQLGRIDIVGRDGINVERVYFPVYPSWKEQWSHPQIQEYKREFFSQLARESHKKKIEEYVSFIENILFEIGEYSELSSTLKFLEVRDDLELSEEQMAQRILKDRSHFPAPAVNLGKAVDAAHLFYHQQVEPVKLLHPRFYIMLEKMSMSVRPFYFRRYFISFFTRVWMKLKIISPLVLLGVSSVDTNLQTIVKNKRAQESGSVAEDLAQVIGTPKPYQIVKYILSKHYHRLRVCSLIFAVLMNLVLLSYKVDYSQVMLADEVNGSLHTALNDSCSLEEISNEYISGPLMELSSGLHGYFNEFLGVESANGQCDCVTPSLQGMFWSCCSAFDTSYRTSYDDCVDVPIVEVDDFDDKSKSRVARLDYFGKTTIGADIPLITTIFTFVPILQIIFAFFMLLSFFIVRVPAIIFASEKEIVHRLELGEMWLDRRFSVPMRSLPFYYWSKLAIKSVSFPMMFYDKYIKTRVLAKCPNDQQVLELLGLANEIEELRPEKDMGESSRGDGEEDSEEVTAIIGLPNSNGDSSDNPTYKSTFEELQDMSNFTGSGLFSNMAIRSRFDFEYNLWALGVLLVDPNFLYELLYFLCACFSLMYPFCNCLLLLDIVRRNKTLKNILRSLTVNGWQLTLSFILMAVVVYVYSVVAFNYFRRFYVFCEADEDSIFDPRCQYLNLGHINETLMEPFRNGSHFNISSRMASESYAKCDTMLNCFLFHLSGGIRAGGGIGDVIRGADGDPAEGVRLFFDVTFFFLVIVILLALIQGLIIDAFSELRDKQNEMTNDLETKCFICGLSKERLDIVPHGYENHIESEHNMWNYMFFFLHLLKKPETEYTGQESIAHQSLVDRSFSFFPVGQSFNRGRDNISS
eukprot:Nk52_evm20s2152 gene=Nk52_evmTU20s2152